MDRGAWQDTVHASQSQTQLSNYHFQNFSRVEIRQLGQSFGVHLNHNPLFSFLSFAGSLSEYNSETL